MLNFGSSQHSEVFFDGAFADADAGDAADADNSLEDARAGFERRDHKSVKNDHASVEDDNASATSAPSAANHPKARRPRR